MDERSIENSRPSESRSQAPGVTSSARSAFAFALVAFGPAIVAFTIDAFFLRSVIRWLLFTGATFVSSWLSSGFKSGSRRDHACLCARLVLSRAVREQVQFDRSEIVSLRRDLRAEIGLAISVVHERLRQATRGLKDYRELISVVMEHSPGIFAVKDRTGRILLANRNLENTLGLSRGEAEGKTAYDVFPPSAAQRRKDIDEKVIEDGGPLAIEETLELKDGPHTFLATVFPLRDQHGIFGVCWIETDITERKRAEDSLAQTARELNEAQREAHIGSWRWETATGIIRWSDELYRLHGRNPKLPPPKSWAEYAKLYTAESTEKLRAAIDKLQKDGTPFSLELEATSADGSRRWIAARGEAIYDAANRLVEVRGTSQDITQVKELERAREEWTSVIAHDLRQPIGVIKMSADLLSELHSRKMEQEEGATTARIRSASSALARMVDDLLDLSRLEAKRLKLERKWMDATALVRESVERASHLTSTYAVQMSQSGEPEEVLVDPQRFDQVLFNLLSNAVKYGEKQGAIRVCVDQHKNDVEVSVTNHGRGIQPDEASHLFTRFGRTKTAQRSDTPGLGLGLYIANGIVEAHGGHMWLDSVPGETTTIHFTLPGRELTLPAERLAS